MLQLKNISKMYENNIVLKDISFEVNEGSIIGVVGANGAGKSTLLSIISTVIEDYEGNIYYNGLDVKDNLINIRNKIGYVPQQATLFEDLSVKDNIRFWALENNEEYLEKLLYILELKESLNKKVKNLSGGTKNRVNILIGIINKPSIIILDEPLVGVSLSIKKKFFELLKELASDSRLIFMSSHELWELEMICTDILIVRDKSLNSFNSIEVINEICKEQEIKFWDYICEEGGL